MLMPTTVEAPYRLGGGEKCTVVGPGLTEHLLGHRTPAPF